MSDARLWVKICGITRLEDAVASIDAGADAIGVNFVSGSRRYCDPAQAEEIARSVRGRLTVFGVFADAPRESVSSLVRRCHLGGVQFHGSEAEEFCRGWSVPVLRAVKVTNRPVVADALVRADGYRLLLDSGAGGGSGQRFDEETVHGLDLSATIVAGGLTPDNVAGIVRRLRPWGVDVAGGVEHVPGEKDHALIREFIRNASAT